MERKIRVEEWHIRLVKERVSKEEWKRIQAAVNSVALAGVMPGLLLFSLIFFAIGVISVLNGFIVWTWNGVTRDLTGAILTLCFLIIPIALAISAIKVYRKLPQNRFFIQKNVIDRAEMWNLQDQVARDLAYEAEKQRQMNGK